MVDFPWVPPETLPALQRKDRIAFRDLKKRIHSRRIPASERLALEALLDLASNRPSHAIAKLEDALAKEHVNGAIQNDMAVGYLALYEKSTDPKHLLLALSAADVAVRLAPDSLEARFNLALTLQMLFLYGPAGETWYRYLKEESDPDWLRDANGFLSSLETKASGGLENENLLGASKEKLAQGVEQDPQWARTWVQDELLGLWGELYQRDEYGRAEEILAAVRTIGKILKARQGDLLIDETASEIDTAASQANKVVLNTLAEAHGIYAEGIRLFRRGEQQRALGRFLEADARFAETGSPFQGWARVHAANCAVHDKRFGMALDLLRQCVECQRSEIYPALASRTRWIQGVCHLKLGKWGESHELYRKALYGFLRLGEKENSAALHFNIGESLRLQGQAEAAWRHRFEALRLTRKKGSSAWFHNALFDGAEDLRLRGQSHLALYFYEEMVRSARLLKRPVLEAEALLRRARALNLAGEDERACSDVRSATAVITKIDDPSQKQALEAEVAVAQAEILAKSKPALALEFVDRAMSYFRSHDTLFRLPELFGKRAEILIQQRRPVLAERDLLAGLEELERERKEAQGDLRISFWDQRRALFDSMISLQVEHLRNTERALQFNEWSRAREFFDRFGSTEILQAEEFHPSLLAAALPERVGLLEYRLTDDRLYIWLVAGGEVHFAKVAVDQATLNAAIGELWVGLVEGRLDKREEEILSDLFRLLISPHAEKAKSLNRLLVVPDDVLHLVPFPALRDPATGNYLIQSTEIVVAPSLGALIHLGSIKRGPPPVSPSVLVVADPLLLDRPSKLPLPATRSEGKSIAALYQKAGVAFGERATRQMVIQESDSYDVLHLGMHSERVGLTQSPALLTASAVVQGEEGDSILSAQAIAALRFKRCKIVVLGLCEGGFGKMSASEGALSLARAFLIAGASSVITSLVPVEDRAAEGFLIEVHRGLVERGDAAHALRQAQLVGIKHGKDGVWATFEVIGGF